MKRFLLALLVVLGAAGAGAFPAAAAQDDDRLDPLFDKLHAAQNPVEVKAIEQAIWTVWLESQSPTVNLLLGGGIEAMQSDNYPKALAFFNVVVELAPDFAEGWNKRATVHFLLRDPQASVADIQKVLALEPRHFGALAGLAVIRETEKDWKGALDAFERAMAANPHMEGGKERLRQLTRRAKGDPI